MDLTLDDYLRQVDQWKQAVSDRMAALDPAGRIREDQEARAWMEGKLGRPLQDSPATKTQETLSTPCPG
jgi:hypothetical protein